jgi:hypothetical protein
MLVLISVELFVPTAWDLTESYKQIRGAGGKQLAVVW